LAQVGGKGLFVKELETALLEDRADIAVHSLKDMPAAQPKGLELAAYCQRADHRDVLITTKYYNLAQMPAGAIIGTSSVRRVAQLKIAYPNLRIVPLRGNVDSRLHKVLAEDTLDAFDGIILASAGIIRLGHKELITEYLPTVQFLPAPGQGIVVIEIKSDNYELKNFVKKLGCEWTTYCAQAERVFNRVLGGSCQTPIAAFAELNKNKTEMILSGQVLSLDGSQQVRSSLSGPVDQAIDLGERLAEQILLSGGQSILKCL
jgi:hydroxymethylbilane synthase